MEFFKQGATRILFGILWTTLKYFAEYLYLYLYTKKKNTKGKGYCCRIITNTELLILILFEYVPFKYPHPWKLPMAEYFRIPGLTLKFDDFRDEATNTYLEYPSYDYEYPHKI